jgi:S-formylglutathione hydrolase
MVKGFWQLVSAMVFCLLVNCMLQSIALAAEGKLVYDKVHSPVLEGNLLGDQADRDVIVYLPPSYETSPDKRYPVVYLLSGYAMHANDWFNWGPTLSGLNRFMSQNPNHEIIVVIPDVYNKYRGSWYVNSSVTGNWEDFIAQDLVQYIDSTYRSLSQRASRGITGVSMGGDGAWILAAKHPEVYSAMYALSGGNPTEWAPPMEDAWRTALSLKNVAQFSSTIQDVQVLISLAAAFSPNPDNPPFYVDFPFEPVDGELKKVESIWQKWVLGCDLTTIVLSHQENLRKLRVIGLDEGKDSGDIEALRALTRTLTDLGIPHFYEEYEGGHAAKTLDQLEARVLPLFAEAFAFELLPLETDVQPRGNLETTWGKTK